MLHTQSNSRGVWLLKFCLLLFPLVLFSAIGHAQVSGVNQAADDYNNNNDSGSSSSGGGSYSYSDDDDDDDWDDDDDYDSYSSDDWGTECCSEMIGGCVEIAVVAFFEENTSIVEDRHADGRPWLLGLQIMPQVGYQAKYHTVYQKPEARFRWGLVGTQLRFTDLSDNTGKYKTTDWQILAMHVPIYETATITFGQGLMWEHRTSNVYYEVMAGLELYFEDHKYNPTIEYRAAIGPDGVPSPRQELSVRFDYNFVNHDIFHLSLSGGYLYQYYYTEVDFHMAQAGLNIGIY